MRIRFRNLKLIIVDEILLVGSNTFFLLDERLRQIFGNKKIFGGKSLIAVGDFNQLPPVCDSFVFTPPRRNKLACLVGSILWNPFLLFELTEIMRQKDDHRFAELLGRLAEGRLTPDDEDMIQKRCFPSHENLPDLAKKSIHLFATSDEVDEYNLKRVAEISQTPDFSRQVIKHVAKDVISGGSDSDRRQARYVLDSLKITKTYGLPKEVILQTGVRYMITTNVDVSDGIFNGATGILRFVELLSTGPVAVWIKFDDETVGAKAKLTRKIIVDAKKLPPTLTPIEKLKKKLQVTRKDAVQVFREQYPLGIAEGYTIHKSQGQSMNVVTVQICKGMRRQHKYVGFSRATTINGLFLIGTFRAPKSPPKTDAVVEELNRLRTENLLTPKFNLFFEVPDATIQVVCHNVQSLHKHLKSITCDPVYINSSLLLFQETWACDNQRFDLNGFKAINRNPLPNAPKAFGTIIFCKASLGAVTTKKRSFEFEENNMTYRRIFFIVFSSVKL